MASGRLRSAAMGWAPDTGSCNSATRLATPRLVQRQTLVVGGQAKPKGAARLLRLDVELLPESAPLLLLPADDLRGTLRRTAAVCRQTKRQEPLLDIGAAEVEIDVVIELRDHFRWCACWRDNRKKTIHDDPRHGFAQRRQIWQAGKSLARSHREAPHLASMHDSSCGYDSATQHLIDATGNILRRLRSRTIRHFDQSEIGLFVEQLCGKRRGASRVVEGDR